MCITLRSTIRHNKKNKNNTILTEKNYLNLVVGMIKKAEDLDLSNKFKEKNNFFSF